MDKAREFQKNIYFCFIDYAKAFDCVDHNKLWEILKEMGMPDHLTFLLRNLYAGQEATVSTGHGTGHGLVQIRKGVHQGCQLSPCLFNLYAEYSMWNAGLDEATGSVMRLAKCSSPFILIKYPQQRKVLQPRSVEHSASGMDLVAQPEMRPHTCARNTPFCPRIKFLWFKMSTQTLLSWDQLHKHCGYLLCAHNAKKADNLSELGCLEMDCCYSTWERLGLQMKQEAHFG